MKSKQRNGRAIIITVSQSEPVKANGQHFDGGVHWWRDVLLWEAKINFWTSSFHDKKLSRYIQRLCDIFCLQTTSNQFYTPKNIHAIDGRPIPTPRSHAMPAMPHRGKKRFTNTCSAVGKATAATIDGRSVGLGMSASWAKQRRGGGVEWCAYVF